MGDPNPNPTPNPNPKPSPTPTPTPTPTNHRREVAVVCALRKFAPPHGASFSRLTFGAAADVGSDDADGDADRADGQVGPTGRLVAG